MLSRAILLWAVWVAAVVPTNSAAQVDPERRQPVPPEDLPRPQLVAFRAQGNVVLDGILDEPSWSLADSTDGTLWLTQPTAGFPARDRTRRLPPRPDPGLRSYPGRVDPRLYVRPVVARRLRRLSRPPPVCPNTLGHPAARFRPYRHLLVPLPHLSTVRASARAAFRPTPQPHPPQPMPHPVPARLSPHLAH